MAQQIQSETKGHWSNSTIEKFKKELFKKKEEILNFQHKIEEHGIANNSEPGDLADKSEEVELWLAKESVNMHVSEELKYIDAALSRIMSGDFGICESCEENIPMNRLRARPDATLCLSCQEFSEKAQASSARRGAGTGLLTSQYMK